MKAKAKGSRIEREVKKLFVLHGFKAVRSAGSLGKADLYIEGLGSVQVKARKSFSVLKLFEGADILVIREDRNKPYVVIELERFIRLVNQTKEEKS